MDHKKFFEGFGIRTIPNDKGGWLDSFTTEDLYQAFKARLIDELGLNRVLTISAEDYATEKARQQILRDAGFNI